MTRRKAFKIEDNIPIPPGRGQFSDLNKKLRSMHSGQSILITGVSRAQIGNIVSNAMGRGNYVTRAELGGFRVWRR